MITSQNDVSVYFRRIKDRISSKEFVKECAIVFAREYGLTSCGRLYYRPCKKPQYIGKNGINISVTHSGDYIAAAFAFAPVGIDLEHKTGRDTLRIAKRFFHPDEYAYVPSMDSAYFFAVWTAKESYVKLTGRGIDDGFRNFSVITDGKFGLVDGNSFSFPYFDEDYSLCVCIKNPGNIIFTEL